MCQLTSLNNFIYFLQLASSPSAKSLGAHALKALLSGTSFQYAKPLLAAEVRRIFPTAAGLPMELGLYTAAVAAADINGKYCKHFFLFYAHYLSIVCLYFLSIVKATFTPALPEPIHVAHLLQTDIQLHAEVKPR